MDTLAVDGRRKRFKPISSGRKLSITSSDLSIMLALQRHGVLPTRYLAAFYAGSESYLKNRLTRLTHDSPLGAKSPVIHRPIGQQHSMYSLSNQCCYALTPEGKAWLRRENLHESSIAPSGWFIHQLMTATVTASIEIAARAHSIEYIPGHKLLQRASATLTFSAKGQRHTPDQLFQLKYPNETYRTFVVECDRGNEQILTTPRAKKNNNKTLQRSFEAYREFIGQPDNRPYQRHYGIKSGLLVLNVMSSTTKMNSIISEIGAAPFMLFQHVAGFDRAFRTPELMLELLSQPWLRPGKAPLSIDS